MAKKKRKKEKTIFVVVEGIREKIFIEFLAELFDPNQTIKLKFHPEYGGSSDAILDRALKNDFYNKVFAIFDEDDKLSKDRIDILKLRWGEQIPSSVNDSLLYKYNTRNYNPIIIVSTPLSIEGVLIRLLGKTLPLFASPLLDSNNIKHNKRIIKSTLSGILGGINEIEYYRNHITKEDVLEKAERIPELKLMLKIFE